MMKGEEAIATDQQASSLPSQSAAATVVTRAGTTEGSEGRIDLRKRFFNIRTFLSFVVAALTMFTVVKAWGVDFQNTLHAMARVNFGMYVWAIVVYAATFPVRGRRWKRLLNNVGLDAPVPALTETILLSWFVNCVAPFKLGDAYRGYLMRKNERFPLSNTLGTIFAERIIDSGALFVILIAGLAFSADVMAPGHTTQILIGASAFMVALLVALGLMRWQGARVVGFLPERFRDYYHRFSQGAFASFNHLPLVFALTLVAWSGEISRLFIVTQALGVHLPFAGILVVLSGASLLLTVPTPGGLGAVEAGLAGLLTLFGVDKDVALAVALLDRVISYWGLVIVGLPTFILSKRTR